jgi:hypothetical protein
MCLLYTMSICMRMVHIVYVSDYIYMYKGHLPYVGVALFKRPQNTFSKRPPKITVQKSFQQKTLLNWPQTCKQMGVDFYELGLLGMESISKLGKNL